MIKILKKGFCVLKNDPVLKSKMLNLPHNVFHNLSVAELYKHAITKEPRNPKTLASKLSSNGSIIAYSGERTGRVPGDKRVVKDENTADKIWWGSVNMPITKSSYDTLEGFIQFI
jgi:ATP-dependent phosphoenolpyruvate carboxykinase